MTTLHLSRVGTNHRKIEAGVPERFQVYVQLPDGGREARTMYQIVKHRLYGWRWVTAVPTSFDAGEWHETRKAALADLSTELDRRAADEAQACARHDQHEDTGKC